MQADQLALHKLLQSRLQWYQHQHRKPMSTPAIAQMLSTILYGKRFFPYYTFNILGGLDEEGLLSLLRFFACLLYSLLCFALLGSAFLNSGSVSMQAMGVYMGTTLLDLLSSLSTGPRAVEIRCCSLSLIIRCTTALFSSLLLCSISRLFCA